MTELKSLPIKFRTASDAIIDGLIAGLISGLVMGFVILLGELLLGDNPAEVLSWFVPAGAATPMLGALVHLAMSAIYGIVFGWLWHLFRWRLRWKLPAWLVGLLYGLAIYFFAAWILLPGVDSALLTIPAWLFGLAHAIFGLLLGWLVGRKEIE